VDETARERQTIPASFGRQLTAGIAARSMLFNVLLYLLTVVFIVLAIPTVLLPRQVMQGVAKTWGRTNLMLLRLICGVSVEWRGLERIPQGAAIVAAKHQSMWETFALITRLPDFAIVVKRELFWLPFFGWFMHKARMIPVDRSGSVAAMRAVIRRARHELGRGRQILIFPEGTRRPVGAPAAYKPGVALLYGGSRAPCLPVALNSGLFWPRRSLWRYPGVVRVEFLEPIPPGLPQDQFMGRLEREIEAASNRLIAESLVR
jgi:1-acyl-sn-glycerol-3-phosphate acyltransferase